MRRGLALAAAVFGLLTIVSGGRALFGGDAARAPLGAVVPFVLWFNFLAGFAYVAAAAGIAFGRAWARPLALAIAATTLTVFLAFGLAVLSGQAFEMRTVGAMSLRVLFWSWVAWQLGRRGDPPSQL